MIDHEREIDRLNREIRYWRLVAAFHTVVFLILISIGLVRLLA